MSREDPTSSLSITPTNSRSTTPDERLSEYDFKHSLHFRVVSFVGSHFDVVPANPEEWSVDPFKLTRDGDKLSGRGVTDCLGHVAMITAFFKELGRHQPKLGVAVKALFIASEEASVIPGVGIEECQKRGELEAFRNGPLIWGSLYYVLLSLPSLNRH